MNGRRRIWPLLSRAVPLATAPVLVACGTGASAGPSHVAEFALGADTPASREFALGPMPGPRVQVLPEPSPAPPMSPVPDPGEEIPLEFSSTPAPAPDPGGQSPFDAAFQPSVAWVDDGEYLGVVTFGSSSCPSAPRGIEVVADQEIEIRLGSLFAGRDVCSADMSGHVTVVELPSGITPTKSLTARFGDHEVTVEAVGG